MPVISADRIFTGNGWLEQYAIDVDKGRVRTLLPRTAAEASGARHYGGGSIVPAFIDVQVYGASGHLFAEDPTAETLQRMQEAFSREGTCLFLPTLATNTMEVTRKAIGAVKAYWEKGGRGVYGLHLEGPWLNKERKGAHVKEWIHPPEVREVEDLLREGKDIVKMITIAPEQCSPDVIDLLLSADIVLSAGHSNASYRQAFDGFEEGIAAVTHLYNAMSPLHHREPGLVGAALNHSSVKASIIPDGYHVDFAAVSIAKKIMGERLFAITDAVTETSTGPYRHQRAGDKYECNGVLSGSALTMHRAFRNLIEKVGTGMEEALRMCSLYPAQLLGCDDRYGRIANGSTANFLVLDAQMDIVELVTL